MISLKNPFLNKENFVNTPRESLKEILGDYALFFNLDLDEVWIDYDWDENGNLDVGETKEIMKVL